MANEPTLTRSVLAGVLAGVLMLALDRLNRAVDFFNGDELTQARSLIPVIASVIAGILIRRLVVPVAAHDAQVEDTALRGIALGKLIGVQDVVRLKANRPSPPTEKRPPVAAKRTTKR